MNLLLLLLFQNYFKSMHTAKTTGNKKKKKIMGSWRGQTIESVRWISRSASPLASSKESRKKSRGGSEREREPLEVRRRQERTQRELESANAKLWLAEHFKQS